MSKKSDVELAFDRLEAHIMGPLERKIFEVEKLFNSLLSWEKIAAEKFAQLEIELLREKQIQKKTVK